MFSLIIHYSKESKSKHFHYRIDRITFINDKDTYTSFGAELIVDYFQNLLLRADRKEGAENNMISHAGIQTFNDNIQPEAREIELTFLVRGNNLSDF